MAYQPFDTDLDSVEPQDLAILSDTHEGWYVEYKSQFIKEKDIAKSLSSFANRHGGWLFFGVQEDPVTLTASSFPGISHDKLPSGLEALRNASKDLLRPSVYYEHRVFEGPIDAIQLPRERSIVAVYVPEGADTPYIHNDGRIYERVGDSSQPRHVTDRATLDRLAQRRRDAEELLRDSLERRFAVSEAEKNVSYLHVYLTSDPYRMRNHRFKGGFPDFTEIMRRQEFPFTNCYSGPSEYIARQTINTDTYMRLLSWHFSWNCDSFVTLPLPWMHPPPSAGRDWGGYDANGTFRRLLEEENQAIVRLLDLNIIAAYFIGVVQRHRSLVHDSEIEGPFYAKVRIENTWRTTPFIDCEPYFDHIREFGVPVVQEENIWTPRGVTLDSFILLDAIAADDIDAIQVPAAQRAVSLMLQVFSALGVPVEAVRQFSNELLDLNVKRQEFQQQQQLL